VSFISMRFFVFFDLLCLFFSIPVLLFAIIIKCLTFKL
jgi:hypothetical protein